MEELQVKRKQLNRIFALVSAGVLCFGAAAMFAGCSSDNPEVTITYTFNGKDYEVDYTLSRRSAPRTVEHFLELAENGYYDGLCIHNYTDTALYAGGYTYDAETGDLTEKNYFETVASWDLTQSVFTMNGEERVGLNTVYGEFSANGVSVSGSKYRHSAGALVMFYPDKGNTNERVYTLRNDTGALQDNSLYQYNCATCLFYTYLGQQNTSLDSDYCVFGMAENYSEQMTGEDGLVTAIDEYIDTLSSASDFTEQKTVPANQYDPFQSIRDDNAKVTYNVPVEPIVIKSVKIVKF